MISIGILGPAVDVAAVDVGTWGTITFGVDAPDDVLRRTAADTVDVLLVDASVIYLTIDIIRWAESSGVRLIAVSPTDASIAWAESLGVATVVRSLADATKMLTPTISAVSDPGVSAPIDSAERGGRVVAVWGPVGSPGVSTAAISLAVIAARAGEKVLLCDADTRGASLAIALAITDEIPGLAAACRLAARGELSNDELERLTQHATVGDVRFAVLTGLPRASRWAAIEPTKLRPVIDLVRQSFDTIVIDAGFGIEENEWIDDAPQRDGAAREILRSADSVVTVGKSDAVGIARLIRALDDAKDLCGSPIVILNNSAAGTARDAIDALERFTDHRVHATISRDSRGGVEEAATRALGNTSWRRVADLVGIRAEGGKIRRRLRR